MTIEQKIDKILNEVSVNNKFLDFINIISFVIGIYNLYLNQQQIDNNEIMKELEKQDNVYFEKILTLLNNKGELK
jgi:hypothetical protein